MTLGDFGMTLGLLWGDFGRLIQGATRIPPSGIGLAVGYGSCICHCCVIILVFSGLFGVVCNVPAD